jgi:hypothetical protein
MKCLDDFCENFRENQISSKFSKFREISYFSASVCPVFLL